MTKKELDRSIITVEIYNKLDELFSDVADIAGLKPDVLVKDDQYIDEAISKITKIVEKWIDHVQK